MSKPERLHGSTWIWENGCEDYSLHIYNCSGFHEEKSSVMKVKYKWGQERRRASLPQKQHQKCLEAVSMSLLQKSLYNNCFFTDPVKTGLWPSTAEYINCWRCFQAIEYICIYAAWMRRPEGSCSTLQWPMDMIAFSFLYIFLLT